MMGEALLRLPKKPGTVIAIGAWWLIRLRSYDDAPSAWELLPFASPADREHAERLGIAAQCIYDDDWVLAEVEQEGGYLVISDPRDEPSGIQYFKPVPVGSVRERTIVNIPIGTRIYLRAVDTMRGAVDQVRENGYVDVLWDNGSVTTIDQEYIGPEAALPSEQR